MLVHSNGSFGKQYLNTERSTQKDSMVDQVSGRKGECAVIMLIVLVFFYVVSPLGAFSGHSMKVKTTEPQAGLKKKVCTW